ncbi:MAG: serine hydrolase domain-containing protein, partial [Methyloligellaceae bacterium]
RIGSAYYAKMLCSGVFVKEWDQGTAVIFDVMPDRHWGLGMYEFDIDRRRKVVTVSLFGLLRRRALFRPGIGCTPVNGTSVDALLAQTKDFKPVRAVPAKLPWPAGWLANTPAPTPGVDRARLTRAVDAAFEEPDPDNLRRTRAVVVVHKGRIIAEQYGQGITPATPLDGWSLTKSAVNALAGVLLEAGKIDLDRKPVLPAWRSATDPRADITIDHLLRMTSGLAFKDPRHSLLNASRSILFERGDTAGGPARTPSAAAPGSRWLYAGASTAILCRVLQDAIGGSLAHQFGYPRRALFDRIGMSSAVLEVDAAGTFMGSAFMYASARDWARLGLLFLRDGVWGRERILPAGWVQRSITPVPASRGVFGASLWLKIPKFLRPEGAGAAPLPDDGFYALGQDGQVIAMFPSRDLVIVRLGVSRRRAAWDPAVFLEEVVAAFPAKSPTAK